MKLLMNLLKINSFFVCFFFLILVSCSDPNEYRIGTEFAEYLQQFEDEAQKRGLAFDLKSSGLIIEFADLKNNNAGLTHFENPIRIEIDKSYWNAISKTTGAYIMKEELLFHELGHGLLNRNHLNSTLANGDWKSMMCGGTKVNNRSWNINYRGIRRQYYINELFDESTLEPEFASADFDLDTMEIKKISYLSFNTAKKEDTGWDLKDGLNYKTSIEYNNKNGRLKFESKAVDDYLVFANISNAIDVNSDFSFEISIQYISANPTNKYGLIMGNSYDDFDEVNDSIEYFTINNNQKMFMGNRLWYSYYTELNIAQIRPYLTNKLKLFKIENVLYYFINNVYFYSTELELTKSQNSFGFLVPSKSTVLIDDYTISKKTLKTSSNAHKISPVKINEGVQFKVQTTKQLKNCFQKR